jgi:hypothetical protein
MPLRSPWMNRFILGFQRRVWCPKWTPASSSCFMVTTAVMTTPSIGWSNTASTPEGDRGSMRLVVWIRPPGSGDATRWQADGTV